MDEHGLGRRENGCDAATTRSATLATPPTPYSSHSYSMTLSRTSRFPHHDGAKFERLTGLNGWPAHSTPSLCHLGRRTHAGDRCISLFKRHNADLPACLRDESFSKLSTYSYAGQAESMSRVSRRATDRKVAVRAGRTRRAVVRSSDFVLTGGSPRIGSHRVSSRKPFLLTDVVSWIASNFVTQQRVSGQIPGWGRERGLGPNRIHEPPTPPPLRWCYTNAGMHSLPVAWLSLVSLESFAGRNQQRLWPLTPRHGPEKSVACDPSQHKPTRLG
jgi:hypothetical protein